jgi:uncharacterized protein (TIGR02996 family)
MPSAEQLAFWAAIRENPAEDTPRLVYADWLEEHGDPERAEFIRVQIELARLGPDPWTDGKGGDRLAGLAEFRQRLAKLDLGERQQAIEFAKNWSATRQVLLDREKDLLDRNRDRWAGPIERARAKASQPVPVEFHRGFAPQLNLSLRAAYHLATSDEVDEPLLIGWIHGTTFDARAEECDLHAMVVAVAGWEAVGWLPSLVIHGATDADVHAIVSAGRLIRLRELHLTQGSVTDAGAAELAASPLLGQLVKLGLEQNRIGDRGALALVESPHLDRLEELHLRRNVIGDDGACAMAASPRVARLKSLSLGYNAIGDRGAQALADSPHLQRVGFGLYESRIGRDADFTSGSE